MTAAQKRKSDDARFEVSPLSSLFGGEVTGFDLKSLPQGIDPSAFLRVVSTHGFLVFRDQELTPSDFASISRFCGELEYHVLDQYRMQIQPEIYVISNVLENGKPIGNPRDGFGWHTDQSYVARPTAYTLLYGVETPPAARSERTPAATTAHWLPLPTDPSISRSLRRSSASACSSATIAISC